MPRAVRSTIWLLLSWGGGYSYCVNTPERRLKTSQALNTLQIHTLRSKAYNLYSTHTPCATDFTFHNAGSSKQSPHPTPNPWISPHCCHSYLHCHLHCFSIRSSKSSYALIQVFCGTKQNVFTQPTLVFVHIMSLMISARYQCNKSNTHSPRNLCNNYHMRERSNVLRCPCYRYHHICTELQPSSSFTP